MVSCDKKVLDIFPWHYSSSHFINHADFALDLGALPNECTITDSVVDGVFSGREGMVKGTIEKLSHLFIASLSSRNLFILFQ